MKQHSIIAITLFLELIVFMLYLLWYYEHDQIIYIFKCFFNPSLNRAGLPTSQNIIKKVIYIIDKLPKLKYTLIDFGCGDGDFINNIYYLDSIQKTIGVELDTEQANNTSKRFSTIDSITILNMDMVDYKFEPVPTIIYMYEPLWLLKKDDAIPIYNDLMKNISLIKSTCYIIYLSSTFPILDNEFFKLYPFKVVYHLRIKRIIGIQINHLFVLKVIT